MGRKKEFKERVGVTGYLEKTEFTELEQIRWREHKDITEILRLAVQEYINNHKEGNDTFKLDEWTTDAEFNIIPTLFGNDTKWVNYIKSSDDDELCKLYIKLKQRRTQVIAEDIIRAQRDDRLARWKLDLPMDKKIKVPLMRDI